MMTTGVRRLTDQQKLCAAFETKRAACTLKHVDADGSFEGYASLFGVEDLGKDVVAAGAFRDSIRSKGPRGLKMLFQHDPALPIGFWVDVREDARGLYVKGQLLQDVEKAREVLSLMRAGAIDGLSIGFKTVEGRRDATSGVRTLMKVDLWEISVVTFPMLAEARVSRVKNAGNLPTEREFERWLTRDAGFSRSEARAVIRSGFKSLRSKLDAAGGGYAALVQGLRHGAAKMRTQPKKWKV